MSETYKNIVNEYLEAYFDEIIKEEKYAKTCANAMKYTTCLGGKRLRAVLCLEANRLFSGNCSGAIPAACAIEMLHSQSLIHDDLPSMDNDDLRRGKPSNHKVFGEAIAILAGDALISLGAQLIIEKTPKNIPAERILKALLEYHRAAGIFGIVGGQTADLEAEKLEGGEGRLEYIQKYKTGALFEASVVTGAIIGGANEDEIRPLRKFAQSFGEAFQTADDILDVISTPAELGKTTGKDEVENKLTYVKKYGLEGAKQKLNSQITRTCDILSASGIKSDVFAEVIKSIGAKIF